MSRRIEVELTSDKGDGTWTWRAAGARQPRGTLDGALLYAGAKAGDVVRAEAEFEIDGITIIEVLPPKGGRSEPERIEVLGPQREFTPVTSNVTPGAEQRAERRAGGRGDRRDRPPRRDDARGAGPGGPGPGGGDRRPSRPRGEGGPGQDPRPPRRTPPPPPPPAPKPKRLRPARTRRDEVLATLAPEQVAVAEHVLRGGIPAVRAAIDEQNAALAAEGQPPVKADNVVALAEELLPRLRLAEWLDRAEAALAEADELSLRDLRSVVVSADDIARDERTRELADRLRAALDARVAKAQAEWLSDVTTSLDQGRVVRALRLSSRPPDPGFRFPPEQQQRLAEAAGAAMTDEVGSDRWATLFDAVAYSPVRRDVTPAGVPAEPSEALVELARKHVGRSPAIASLLGVQPAPSRPDRRRRPSRPTGPPPHVGQPPRPAGAPPPPPPAAGAPVPPGPATGAPPEAAPALADAEVATTAPEPPADASGGATPPAAPAPEAAPAAPAEPSDPGVPDAAGPPVGASPAEPSDEGVPDAATPSSEASDTAPAPGPTGAQPEPAGAAVDGATEAQPEQPADTGLPAEADAPVPEHRGADAPAAGAPLGEAPAAAGIFEGADVIPHGGETVPDDEPDERAAGG